MTFIVKYLRSLKKVGKLFVAGCIAFTIEEQFGQIWLLDGSSMQPSFNDSDVVLALNSNNISAIARKDVVILKHPEDAEDRICKRVIALAGDTISYQNVETKIPDGHMWIEGDNRKEARDSRDYGPVPIGLLVGLVYSRIYPKPTFNKTPLSRVRLM